MYIDTHDSPAQNPISYWLRIEHIRAHQQGREQWDEVFDSEQEAEDGLGYAPDSLMRMYSDIRN
jgi:hypothetical protein